MLEINSSKKSSKPGITSPPDARKKDIRTRTPQFTLAHVPCTQPCRAHLTEKSRGVPVAVVAALTKKAALPPTKATAARAVLAVHNAPIAVAGRRKPPLEASPVVKNAQLLFARASASSRMRSAFARIRARARAHCFHHQSKPNNEGLTKRVSIIAVTCLYSLIGPQTTVLSM